MEYGLVVLWLAGYAAVWLAGLPVAARLFSTLDDRGAGLALPVALAIWVTITFWVGHFRFGWPAILAGLLFLVGLAGAAWRFGARPDRRAAAETGVVFALTFLVFVAVRAADPGIHPFAGERFLDYGLVKTILRANRLPPEDMWFAGEPVQYYYGGQLIAALLARLTGTEARYAYNLAFAGFCSMLVTAAYGLAGSIASNRRFSRRLAGVCGAFFVGFASNLFTPIRMILWILPSDLSARFIGTVAPTYLDIAAKLGPTDFEYVHAKAVIEGTINHFPLYAFLDGELHPHMMSPPFLVLVAGLCYEYYRTPPDDRTHRRTVLLGVAPAVIGLLAVINTWSFPTGAGLVFLAALFSPGRPADLIPADLRAGVGRLGSVGPAGRELSRLAGAVGIAVLAAVLGAVWFAPFFLGVATDRPIGIVTDRSVITNLMLVHGAFLLVFGAHFGSRLLASFRPSNRTLAITATLGICFLIVGALADVAAVALFGPLIAVGWVLLRTRDDAGAGFEAVLVVAGASIVVLVEFLYVQDGAGGRFNTVFKAYMQVWVLWGVAAGALLPELARRGIGVPNRAFVRPRLVTSSLAVVLVLSTSIYGGLAAHSHFDDADDPTLDGWQFACAQHPVEAEAIAWLDRRSGQPHLVSAPGTTSYEWVNPAASLTGLPTVAGWEKETLYRDESAYAERVSDVETIFIAPWPQFEQEVMELLRTYDVTYIYVGPTEETRYGDPTNFAANSSISVAFRNDAVTIYRVADEGSAGETPTTEPGTDRAPRKRCRDRATPAA